MTALILVDLQIDFMPGGALAIPSGLNLLPAVNRLLQCSFDVIVATQDWHPKNHKSFASEERQPGEKILLHDKEQILWPVHCVQNSQGAAFVPGWDVTKVDKVIYKGTDLEIDSYSAFFDNAHLKSTGLNDYLKAKKIDKLYVAGVATDYCIKYSVFDALELGFDVYLVKDACQAINLKPNDEETALSEMKSRGAHVTTSKEIMAKYV